jgi:hypothetical protein
MPSVVAFVTHTPNQNAHLQRSQPDRCPAESHNYLPRGLERQAAGAFQSGNRGRDLTLKDYTRGLYAPT